MVQAAPTNDVVERAIVSFVESANGQIALGVVLVAAGLLLSWFVARRFGRGLPRPPPPLPPRFLPRRDLALVAVALATWVVAVGLAGRAFGLKEFGEHATLADLRKASALTWTTGLALLGALAAATHARGTGLDEVGLTTRRVGTAIALALVLYVAFLPVELGAIAIEIGGYQRAGRAPDDQLLVSTFTSNPAAKRDLLVVTGLTIGAALGEELLFRGVLLRLAQRLLPGWLAIAVVALLFALLHDAGRLPVFALGVALTWLMARTGNLLASIVFHALHNGVTLLLLATTTAGP